MRLIQFEKGECLYANPLSVQEDIKGWKLEGRAKISFEYDRLHLENELDAELFGDHSHWVYWCPIDFPDKIIIEWEFYPLREPGLCMFFFAAAGRNGEDMFDEQLPVRNGLYSEYHSGAINALHLSYFRHKYADERAFRTCNLRKSFGFHLAAIGADPLPPVEDALSPYHMKLVKYEGMVQFSINELVVLEWEDDGQTYGPIYGGGKIGFRQMAPMKAAYANLVIHQAILN
ncbi:uncharacterized protein DUF1961 [Neobacillus bataviensis]|uniref:Uncharacterized protein DUF1961 n=1 Tax=Neobacillus bataviensis TaxID=220685 RepID=A0A561CRR5_9BACI|nr:YesU family protein [Neobacillus bataviensis]TWD93740.1 uncharacterized protein DUF1961 [Neobacillus bataviensis]